MIQVRLRQICESILLQVIFQGALNLFSAFYFRQIGHAFQKLTTSMSQGSRNQSGAYSSSVSFVIEDLLSMHRRRASTFRVLALCCRTPQRRFAEAFVW